jgi:hypothetical protein
MYTMTFETDARHTYVIDLGNGFSHDDSTVVDVQFTISGSSDWWDIETVSIKGYADPVKPGDLPAAQWCPITEGHPLYASAMESASKERLKIEAAYYDHLDDIGVRRFSANREYGTLNARAL